MVQGSIEIRHVHQYNTEYRSLLDESLDIPCPQLRSINTTCFQIFHTNVGGHWTLQLSFPEGQPDQEAHKGKGQGQG